MKKIRISVRDISIYGVYTAIFLMMAFIPQIGYIKFGVINATLMAVPVAIIAVHKGIPGAIFGLFMFGLTSFFHELAFPVVATALQSYSKMFVAFFFGRLLIGVPLISFILFANKIKMNIYLKSGIIGLIISIFNTIIIIGLLTAYGMGQRTFWTFFILVSINIWIEWTVPVFIAIATASLASSLSLKDKSEKKNRY